MIIIMIMIIVCNANREAPTALEANVARQGAVGGAHAQPRGWGQLLPYYDYLYYYH